VNATAAGSGPATAGVAAAAAIAAAGARALNAGALPERLRFSTDTRSLRPGEVYVALIGATYDGHGYVAEALKRGAAAVVVSDPRAVPAGAAALVVADTKAAYLAFGGLARTASQARFVSITGSTGKTTTKALLAQMLERVADGRVVATPANENNEIGVAKLLLGLPPDAAFVVVEHGARHAGDIEPLARATRPEVAILTNVGEAHLEIMGSREALAETKWGIFATGASAVLNARDPVSLERVGRLPGGARWFAASEPAVDARASGPLLFFDAAGGMCVREGLGRAAQVWAADVRLPGAHNRENVAAAAAGALALGCDPARIAASLGELVLPAGRYERIVLRDYALVYDGYNASMSGALATLASFAREPARRRIALLGSMAELGTEAAEMHARVGSAAADSSDLLLVGGEFAPDLARGARERGMDPANIVPFDSNAGAVAWLLANVRDGDLILVKGSRRYRLEEVVAGLRAAHG
jgi:UDP-N-acetylmuramoyl-tripeptide--D-alanyl-D-alanine ligase